MPAVRPAVLMSTTLSHDCIIYINKLGLGVEAKAHTARVAVGAGRADSLQNSGHHASDYNSHSASFEWLH